MESIPPDHPMTQFFNQIGPKYEEAYAHDEGLHKAVRDLLQLLPPDASVLDCGCGTGKPVATMVAGSGRRVHGIDRSETMVELSRRQVPSGTFEKADMLKYCPEDASFSAIIAMLSLFELSRVELVSVADSFHRWLQPEGYLLMGVIGADDRAKDVTAEMWDADSLFASGIPTTFMGRLELKNLFTKKGWNALLEGAGLKVLSAEVDVFKPPPDAGCDDEPHYFVIAKKNSNHT